jgi:hypothetical protein
MSKNDERLDALLARGRLGGPARDRILAGALAKTAAPHRWRRLLTWAVPMTAAAAAAVVLLSLRPPEFRARGGAGPVLEIACRDGSLSACPSGSTLLFRSSGVAEGGFLSAWAVPEGSAARVWYFPADNGASPALAARPETQTLARGIRLGPEQPPGRYRVHLVLSRRPLTRAEAAAPPPDALVAEAEATLEVVR